MVDFQIVLWVFCIVFIAEIGDKTQIVAFSLTSSTRSPRHIFFGTSAALAASSLIASATGGFFSNLIPSYTAYISIALFFIFGFYIIFSKEPPKIKQALIKCVMLEKTTHQMLPRLFKKYNMPGSRVKTISTEDEDHAGIIRFLIKQKKLFKDDINDLPRINNLIGDMDIDIKILKGGFKNGIEKLIKIESVGIDFYTFLHDHLKEGHPEEEKLRNDLSDIIIQEKEHLGILNSLLEKPYDQL
ncbi:MAG: TMEM165/GDT1 family protein [bacterium]